MKNTPENKAKFFAQYWGQKILKFKYSNGEIATIKDLVEEFTTKDVEDYPDWFIELKPLSQITDKDAIEVFDILFSEIANHKNKPIEFKIEFGKKWSDSIFRESFGHLFPKGYSQMIDYLRFKGYSLAYLGISVETLVEWGWIKLKN